MAFDPQRLRQLSSREASSLGLPEGWRTYSPFPFGGTNQQDAPHAMPDEDFFWLENIIRYGRGKLRSVPGQSTTPLYTATAGLTIVYAFFYEIGATSYCAIFLSNGTAVQVNVNTLGQTTLSSVVGTFYDSSVSPQLPSCVQWGTKYLLISSNNRQNDYWVWDGAILYTAGSVAPEPEINGTGEGYGSTAPVIAAFGGHGTGVTATATISAGGVVDLDITNPGSGYQPSEIVQFRFTGGGADDAGLLTALLTATTVASVEVTDPGYGYVGVPGVTLTGGGGAGATAVATVMNGVVTAVTVTAPGAAYTSAPTVVFSGGTPTKAASAAAYLTAVSVASVAVTAGGTGYTLPPKLSVEGGGGTPLCTVSTRLTGTGVSYIRIDSPGGNPDTGTTTTFYTTVPGVVFYVGSGGGAGAAATASVRDGLLESVVVVAAGAGYTLPPRANYEGSAQIPNPVPVTTVFLVGTSIGEVRMRSKGDGYTDAPAILIDPGFNTSAYARVELMPFIVSGAALETFQSRVWAVFPKAKQGSTSRTDGTLITTDASSLTAFNTVTVNEQSILRSRYTGIKQANGYLYTFGDSSIDIISNVQTIGDPAITTFNVQNVEPQIGTIYRDTIQPLGRALYFANKNGVFRLLGGAVQRVSDKLNDVFETAIFPDVDPTAATPIAGTVYIHNNRYYVLLLTITDPFTALPRDVLLAYDEAEWYVLTQETSPTAIFTRVVEGDLQLYGTDGATLRRLFTTPSALEKIFVTKLYGADQLGFIKQVHNISIQGEDLSSNGSGFEATLTVNTEQPGAAAAITLPATADLADQRVFVEGGGDVRAGFVGLTFGSTSPDFAIYNASIGYTIDQGPLGTSGENASAA